MAIASIIGLMIWPPSHNRKRYKAIVSARQERLAVYMALWSSFLESCFFPASHQRLSAAESSTWALLSLHLRNLQRYKHRLLSTAQSSRPSTKMQIKVILTSVIAAIPVVYSQTTSITPEQVSPTSSHAFYTPLLTRPSVLQNPFRYHRLRNLSRCPACIFLCRWSSCNWPPCFCAPGYPRQPFGGPRRVRNRDHSSILHHRPAPECSEFPL